MRRSILKIDSQEATLLETPKSAGVATTKLPVVVHAKGYCCPPLCNRSAQTTISRDSDTLVGSIGTILPLLTYRECGATGCEARLHHKQRRHFKGFGYASEPSGIEREALRLERKVFSSSLKTTFENRNIPSEPCRDRPFGLKALEKNLVAAYATKTRPMKNCKFDIAP